MLSNPNLLPVLMLVGLAVAIFMAIWLQIAYGKKKSPSVKYMAVFFWTKIAFLAMLIVAMTKVFSYETSIAIYNIAPIFINIGLYGGIVYFICDVWFKDYKKTITKIALIIIALTTIIAFFTIPKPSDVNPYNMMSKPNQLYLFFSHLVIMVGAGLGFIIRGLKETDKKLMQKALFLGAGMAVAALSGTTLGFFSSITVLNSLLILNAFGHASMAVGALIRPE